MDRDGLKDLQEGKFSKRDEIADLQIYQLEGITYSLPINSTPELRMHMAAAIKKYKNSDAEYEDIMLFQERKDYLDSKYIDKYLMINFSIARDIDILVNILNDLYSTLTKKGTRLTSGEIVFFNSMSRLKESFKSAIILIDNGFFIELMPVLRLIYEQLCWSCYVIDESDNDKILTNWTTKNTKYLKEKINPEYGRLYDILSKETHMAPPVMDKYLNIDEGNKCITVRGRSGMKAREDIPFLIKMLVIYIDVFDYGINHFEIMDEDNKYYTELLTGSKLLCNTYKSVLADECEFILTDHV